ncbi:MAG: pyruvate dehydrogenase complex dihydrolipoamide acetyltransferase [Gemmatimonadetes bacterium 13_1_40CM_3_66_12]|nr:MAG: pyruvate dehydrogenase complex dihydrolipoamide acetyltransferase [Gemmatimonadetes bacterium 13_1_40CM_3_66_12]
MATKVHMEALSPTMEEGRLVKWTKHEGDPVKSGDTLAEVETDKAVMELVARADGQLLKVMVPEGTTVPVGNVVAWIGKPGEKVDGDGAGAPAPKSQRSAVSGAREDKPAPAPPSASPRAAPSIPANPSPPIAPADATRVKASPLAKRLAKDAGVDLKLIQGSGPGGRVIKRDVEAAPTASAATASAAQAPAVPRTADRAPRTGVPYEDVPLTQIRKTIAKRLAASIGPIPHFFLTTEIDMERAVEAREALNQQLGEAGGKISFNDIIIKAVALALVQHRACNAWFQDDHIRYWNEVHIGMAVAIEDGLITPVIRNADQKNLREIGAESRELAGRARNRRLKPEEYTGATFSVSNLGMFDIDQFTAVINPPEAGIVAIGSIVAKAIPDGDRVVVRRRLRLTMSCDHRVIDGATGAVFLKTLKQMLENPLAMLL